MRKRTLALCLTLLTSLILGAPGAVSAGDASCLMSKSEIFGCKPQEAVDCRISCNMDFNVYCIGSGLFT